jgi:hypothetical protein
LSKKLSWKKGFEYYRLDGSINMQNRRNICLNFNSSKNEKTKHVIQFRFYRRFNIFELFFRLILVSTLVGGLGINMTAANRVIIFDVSWNPSHDVQSMFRVYRFGQKKECFIYRFVSYVRSTLSSFAESFQLHFKRRERWKRRYTKGASRNRRFRVASSTSSRLIGITISANSTSSIGAFQIDSIR